MQKRSREGFTLIELLAVIVILAIIALIAVPVIMNVITKARVSAFEDSAYGIVKAGEMYYTNALLDAESMTEDQEFEVNGGVFKNTKNSDTLEISGSLPSSGKVMVTTEGKVAIVISNGEYCIQKSTSESKVEAVKQANCTDYKKTANPVFTTSTENASIPACITDNTACAAGTPVAVKVNDTETYDFYVMRDNTSKNKITLIMNENLGDPVAWSNNDNSEEPVVALAYLKTQTSGWTNIPETTARVGLISYAEADSLHDNSWLYENGGNYWTITANAGCSGFAWYVSDNGYLVDDIVTDALGIRPVITISKTTI